MPVRSSSAWHLTWRNAAWITLLVVAVTTLAIGSVHPNTPSRVARIAYLESVIRCPECVDISIAQSTTLTSINLRNEVKQLVDRGWSDAAIEARVISQYGSSEIMTPSTSGIDLLAWVLPLGVGILAVVLLGSFFLKRRSRRVITDVSKEDEDLVARAIEAAGSSR